MSSSGLEPHPTNFFANDDCLRLLVHNQAHLMVGICNFDLPDDVDDNASADSDPKNGFVRHYALNKIQGLFVSSLVNHFNEDSYDDDENQGGVIDLITEDDPVINCWVRNHMDHLMQLSLPYSSASTQHKLLIDLSSHGRKLNTEVPPYLFSLGDGAPCTFHGASRRLAFWELYKLSISGTLSSSNPDELTPFARKCSDYAFEQMTHNERVTKLNEILHRPHEEMQRLSRVSQHIDSGLITLTNDEWASARGLTIGGSMIHYAARGTPGNQNRFIKSLFEKSKSENNYYCQRGHRYEPLAVDAALAQVKKIHPNSDVGFISFVLIYYNSIHSSRAVCSPWNDCPPCVCCISHNKQTGSLNGGVWMYVCTRPFACNSLLS
jgi:hypothetical protein